MEGMQGPRGPKGIAAVEDAIEIVAHATIVEAMEKVPLGSIIYKVGDRIQYIQGLREIVLSGDSTYYVAYHVIVTGASRCQSTEAAFVLLSQTGVIPGSLSRGIVFTGETITLEGAVLWNARANGDRIALANASEVGLQLCGVNVVLLKIGG